MQTVQQLLEDARAENRSLISILIDPDKTGDMDIDRFADMLQQSKVDLLMVGGSLLVNSAIDSILERFRNLLDIPVVIFPGHPMQVSANADAILLLSLISGRNPELLIGQHVHAAPMLKRSKLEILPTGYMLVDGDMPTTVSYISNTQPIPRNKPEIAACTAMAGEMLGLRNLYLEAGSGAKHPVPVEIIKSVKAHTSLPLFVGGGIRTAEAAALAVRAGADVVVVGSAVETNSSLIKELSNAIHG